ncbi:MAG: hypothetical protein IT288_17780 [Bdellovibrionales bacterium]|nr:hypothetical protein [Bdellovibrionales bacterium]
MSRLSKALAQLKFDSRMTEWNQNQGLVTPEEVKKHLDSLPDLSSRALQLTLEDETNGADDHPMPTGMDHNTH